MSKRFNSFKRCCKNKQKFERRSDNNGIVEQEDKVISGEAVFSLRYMGIFRVKRVTRKYAKKILRYKTGYL